MSKTRDALTHPVFLPRVWGRGTQGRPLPRPFYGLDTERNTQAGADFGEFVCGWISNDQESKPFRTFTDLPPATYWVWNLAYDLEGMVRDLRQEEGWAMREDGSRFTLMGASCAYYKGKRFEWKDATGRRIFLEASSFFNRVSLKDAAKSLCKCLCIPCQKHKKQPREYQHCGVSEDVCPMKDPVDAARMSYRRYHADPKYRAIVDEYCAKDARIAWRLMAFLEAGFNDLGVVMAGTPGSTAKRFLSNIAPFPKVVWGTHRQFLATYCGGRFELTRRGVFHDARQYDIISAYPWALAKCPMLSANAWHRSTRRLSDDALYGAYEVRFKTDEYLGVMPGWRGNTRVYTAQEERGWMSRPELQWLQGRGHRFDVLRGVEVFDETPTDGWRQLVEPLFNMKDGHIESCPIWSGGPCADNCRKALKGQPKSLGAKVGVNSLYGILIQLIQKGGVWVPIDEAVNPVDFAGVLALEKGPKAFDAGQFYAPIYSATLTSMVRVQLLKTAIQAGEGDIVAFHTDAILLKDGATIPVGKEMGDWELAKTAIDELVILKSGQYAMDNDVKGRGFSKRKLNPESEDEIAVRQKVDLWAGTHTRRGRIGIATTSDWRDVSVIREKQVANNIAWELKRNWQGGNTVRDILRTVKRKEFVDSTPLRNVQRFGLNPTFGDPA